jgi:hypothetical protein
MKSIIEKSLLSILWVLFLTISTPNTFAANIKWELVDTPAISSAAGFPWALAKDSKGFIYAAGFDGGACIIRKSDRHGHNWQTVDTFLYSSTSNYPYDPVIAVSSKDVFAGCQGQTLTGEVHWLIRKSHDHGQSWQTVDDWEMPNGFRGSELRSIVVNDDHVYYVGTYWNINNTNQLYGVVRGSSKHGKIATWQTLDTFSGENGNGATANGLAIDSHGHLYVAASVGFSVQNPNCHNLQFYQSVRISRDHGSHWLSTDHYFTPGKCSNFPTSVIVDKNGVILVPSLEQVFDQTAKKNRTFAYLRSSENHGASWLNIDEYTVPGGSFTEGYAANVNHHGKIFWAGDGRDATGHRNWFVRTQTPSGWETIDLDAGPSNLGARANSIVFGTEQSIYVGGLFFTSLSPLRSAWLVKKGTFSDDDPDQF